MFCKWCGNTIQLTDKTCPSCGRETPPIADCGGLYNLNCSNNTSDSSEEMSHADLNNDLAIEELKSIYLRDRKKINRRVTFIWIYMLVLAAMIVILGICIDKNNDNISRMEEVISEIKKDIVQEEEAINEETQTETIEYERETDIPQNEGGLNNG
ncbi:MAG: zinc-ribbon domain-containing protein [Lachnospiraceae bacterium]|nr:zinc-ribbon domain-containing protein [Lachnospiraceae bacterium]